MEEIPYVGDEAAAFARSLEEKIRQLPAKAGILFVGVEPEPAPGGASIRYVVRLGIDRKFEKNTGVALVRQVLSEEIQRGEQISVSVYRGVAGAKPELSLPRLGAASA